MVASYPGLSSRARSANIHGLRVIRSALFLAVLICSEASFAATEIVRERSPFFQGDALPVPPQQNALWPHGDDALSKAAATLFEQGLANPTGLEYREIEIGVAEPWSGGGYPVKTHGWVLPSDGNGGSFAVAWDGLVYPALSVGAVADLRQDWAAVETPSRPRDWEDASAASAIGYNSMSPLKLVLLLRLGESETVARLSKAVQREDADPYLGLARDWAWFAFERAACAHERGDDRLALADARLLTRVQPLIDAEAERRGFKRRHDESSTHRPLAYLPFLTQLPALLADSERRVAGAGAKPANEISALIDDLQNVAARQDGQPGGVSLAGDTRVQALVQRGDAAVEPLLSALESDTRLTRSVGFGRDFFRDRHLLSVADAARAALEALCQVRFNEYGEKGGPHSNQEMAAQIRAYWVKMGALAPMERFYTTLKDDHANPKEWMQAASNIVRPNNVRVIGAGVTYSDLKTGQKAAATGEALRDGRSPSIAQLLAQRSDDLAAIRTHSTDDHFLFIDAGEIALFLNDWDKEAALPVLKRRLARAWSIGAERDDILAFNGTPIDHFGRIIARMTQARAQAGDDAAWDELSTWMQKTDLKRPGFGGGEVLKALARVASRPSVAQMIDYLFNDPRSPWSNVFAKSNGIALSEVWRTPLPMTLGFRRQSLRGLADKTPEGVVTFQAFKESDGTRSAQVHTSGINFSISTRESDLPPPGEQRAFRLCDTYAYFYSRDQKGPPFELYWSEEKRDAGVLACRRWLEEAK